MTRLKEVNYKRFLLAIGLAVAMVCPAVLDCKIAWALGTPADTAITNTAVIDYTLDGGATPQTVTAASTFTVLEVIDAVLVWQDAAAVPVDSPQADRPLTFLLTNTGNGPESFWLSTDDTLAGDAFNPAAQALWLESNGVPDLQTTGATPDTFYRPGVDDPDLPADGAVLIYLLSDIPSGLNDGDTGRVQLSAAAVTPGAAGAAPGTELAGAGPNGIAAVVGLSGAQGTVEGEYRVSSISVDLTKTIQRIVDPGGGGDPHPGARVTYRITVEVTGGGTAQGLVVTDPIPVDMTYVPESIVLDGAAQTDSADAPIDNSDFNETRAGTVTVNLGDTAAPAVHTIEFATTIN